MTYFCTKCNHNHVRGKIFEKHKQFAKDMNLAEEEAINEGAIPKEIKKISKPDKPMETDWKPLFRTGKMSRYNASGDYVERYMTKKEELEYARSIALERGQGWNRLKEWRRRRKLKKMEDES
jgi:hypothetical protein